MKKKQIIKYKRGDKIKIIKGCPPFYRKGDIGKIMSTEIDPYVYWVNFRRLTPKWYHDGRWYIPAEEMEKI